MGHGLVQIKHRRQGLQFKPHGAPGALSHQWIRVGQQQDGFLRVGNEPVRQGGLVIIQHRNAVARGDVRGRGHHHAAPVEGGIEVDGFQDGTGKWAAHRDAVQQPFRAQIVHISGLSGDFGPGIGPGCGNAGAQGLHGRSCAFRFRRADYFTTLRWTGC